MGPIAFAGFSSIPEIHDSNCTCWCLLIQAFLSSAKEKKGDQISEAKRTKSPGSVGTVFSTRPDVELTDTWKTRASSLSSHSQLHPSLEPALAAGAQFLFSTHGGSRLSRTLEQMSLHLFKASKTVSWTPFESPFLAHVPTIRTEESRVGYFHHARSFSI